MDPAPINSVGVAVLLGTGQDLTDATCMEIKVVRPDGTTVAWEASVATLDDDGNPLTPADGYLRYTTVSSDLAIAGAYNLQAYVEWGTGSSHRGAAVVWDILPEPPAWSNISAVRLELGKGPSVALLTDQEIAYFLTRSSGNVLLAASFGAESLAGYYADLVDKSMDSSSVSLSQKAEAWRKKAAALRSQALNPSLTPRFSSSATRALKFDIDQHDHPGLSTSGTVVGDETW